MSKDKAPIEFVRMIANKEILTKLLSPADRHMISKAVHDYEALEAKLAECVAALESIIPYAEMGVPGPGHFGSCTPESMCDMTCSDSFHGAKAIYSAREILAKVKK